MATIVLERIGHVFISLQQIQEVPGMLAKVAPSMPGTVRATEVPHYFREHYIFTGYWRYYFPSMFQRHNETIESWTHLLAFLVFLWKLLQLPATVDFLRDPHSWPLLVLIVSSLTYTACSVAAHLLAGKVRVVPLHLLLPGLRRGFPVLVRQRRGSLPLRRGRGSAQTPAGGVHAGPRGLQLSVMPGLLLRQILQPLPPDLVV